MIDGRKKYNLLLSMDDFYHYDLWQITLKIMWSPY